MLTGDDRVHRMDEHGHEHEHDLNRERDHDRVDHAASGALTATEEPDRFPHLEEPSWLDDEDAEEMEEPRDSAFRGIWIGVLAAAITFGLVFAIPHWLGWYDLGPATPRAKREVTTPDSVISTVTAKPSTTPAEPAAGQTVAAAPAPPAAVTAPTAASTPPPSVTPPPAVMPPSAVTPPASAGPTLPPAAREAKPAPREPKATVASREAKPAAPTREPKAASAASASRRTFAVQIAAFKNPRQAGRVAENAKKAGYSADVLRVDSSPVPWVVRVSGYSTREQAESARDALARKGFRGGFIL
jgi:septal ring-binding cell division protein DamX